MPKSTDTLTAITETSHCRRKPSTDLRLRPALKRGLWSLGAVLTPKVISEAGAPRTLVTKFPGSMDGGSGISLIIGSVWFWLAEPTVFLVSIFGFPHCRLMPLQRSMDATLLMHLFPSLPQILVAA